MTPRKGNLMGVRTDIKVLDATIRDGGLCNNFDFSDEFVRELYKTNIKSGVDYMEFGYKASRTLFNEADFGKWKFCKEEDIRAIVGENVSDMKISVMADVGRCDFKTDFLPGSESVIDMVRVACYIHQIPAAIEMIEYFHDLGYETTCNIMAISQAGQVLVGYLTGTGRDLMESLGYDAEGVYYLPNLRMRFVESTLYPFIGGDTIRRSERLEGGLQPSVNRILPYASPEFSPLDPETAWDLSLCCLENARNILLALETEYRRIFARNLTLARLSEAVILPLCPDKGGSMTYDLSRGASTYLDDDIELLKRMRFAPKEVKE